MQGFNPYTPKISLESLLTVPCNSLNAGSENMVFDQIIIP